MSLYFNIFGQKSIPRRVSALDLLLAVDYPWTWPRGTGKHLVIPIQSYLLSNFCVNKSAQKSIPGGVLALLLLLTVYGSGLDPDGPGEPEEP